MPLLLSLLYKYAGFLKICTNVVQTVKLAYRPALFLQFMHASQQTGHTENCTAVWFSCRKRVKNSQLQSESPQSVFLSNCNPVSWNCTPHYLLWSLKGIISLSALVTSSIDLHEWLGMGGRCLSLLGALDSNASRAGPFIPFLPNKAEHQVSRGYMASNAAKCPSVGCFFSVNGLGQSKGDRWWRAWKQD